MADVKHAEQARSWLSYAETSAGEAKTWDYPLVCAVTAQTHALLAIAESIDGVLAAVDAALSAPRPPFG